MPSVNSLRHAHSLSFLRTQMNLDGFPCPVVYFSVGILGSVQVVEDMIISKITPHECRLRDMTYGAPIFVDVEYTRYVPFILS